MLVLGRRKDQTIWIGNACVTILEIRGKGIEFANKVRVGVECPKDIPVYRGELESRTPGKLAFIPAALIAKLPRILSYVAESPAGTPEADCAELARVILGQVSS